MQEIAFNDGLTAALDSLLNNRLAILVGAGLSMAPPSCLPSAADLATAAKQKYDATYGATRAPLPPGIEQQAEFFFGRGELDTVYFHTLIDQHAFSGPPNSGHYALADLLLVQAVHTAITTNVDTLIETAGQFLSGEIGAGIDGHQIEALPANTAPLLKIHGCRLRDRPNMVWAPGQVNAPPVAARITSSTAWLNARLVNRDFLIVGYWTDWDYLNAVLAATLGAVNPVRVIVVNPAEGGTFAVRAPDLFALAQRATISFRHVRTSGAHFLENLRREFSRSCVRRVLHSGVNDYLAQTGHEPNAAWKEPGEIDNDILWQTRRDLEGCAPNAPSRQREPPHGETLLGLTLLQLQAAGASADGPYWLINGLRVRVVRAVNKFLHRVEAEFEREVAPAIAPDIVIAVGAEAQSLAKNIVRVKAQPTIARGNNSRWMTRPDAVRELGL